PEGFDANAPTQAGDVQPAVADATAVTGVLTPEQIRRQQHVRQLQAQRESFALCDQQFSAAIRHYQLLLEQLKAQPGLAALQCLQMVTGFVGDMLGSGESSIRLLSEGAGDRASMHPVNVTVLSLLLGKSLGLGATELHDLGSAAFLHDIGKTQLPERVRWQDNTIAGADQKAYQDHVAHGVLLAQRLELPAPAVRAIAEHHEMMDGGGFPRHLGADAISQAGRILALVNRYENMCNPGRPSAAVTPHEALSLIFSQLQTRFDGAVLAAFIRMMGVYPPGSIVQLSTDQYALVVSVNSARPLKPRVIVHDAQVPREQALILDLEQDAAPGIRRSIKPATLPKAAFDYLSPRARICYFFERAVLPELAVTAP
ncbi:MAG: HD domain-containing protein, partial [Rhodoferax sp.]|nr:HD domain-containing protein [Rhodoferax sp.]